MEQILFFGVIVVAVIGVLLFFSIKQKRDLDFYVRYYFGKEPKKRKIKYEYINLYWKNKKNSVKYQIDDITWNDLDMNSVFEKINVCLTSVGEEYMYAKMHMPEFDKARLDEFEELINYFDTNEKERIDVMKNFARLGKLSYNGLIDYVYNIKDIKEPKNAFIYKIMGTIPVVGICMFPFDWIFALEIIIVSAIINIIIHYKCNMDFNSELGVMEYFCGLMNLSKSLCKSKEFKQPEYKKKIVENYNKFKGVASTMGFITSRSGGDMDAVWDYFQMLFLIKIRQYNKYLKKLITYQKELIELYELVGEIDMAISVLSYRKTLKQYCIPTFNDNLKVDTKELVHPLIENPVNNTFDWCKDSILTGSNASGKSTFIKALAINGILAQTIHTCTASTYKCKMGLVISSMAVKDNIVDGESYFIVEIKYLKRIIDYINKEVPCYCYIDEILRGTNTIERISASAAILQYLADKNCICLVASHDIELVNLLSKNYSNYHFCEEVTKDGLTFDYKVKTGPATTRNAIKLLDYIGFDKQIIVNAQKLVSNLDK